MFRLGTLNIHYHYYISIHLDLQNSIPNLCMTLGIMMMHHFTKLQMAEQFRRYLLGKAWTHGQRDTVYPHLHFVSGGIYNQHNWV